MKKMKTCITAGILACVMGAMVGCNEQDVAPKVNQPSEEPTLEELVKVFKNVDTKYYISEVKKASSNFTKVQKADLENLKNELGTAYGGIKLPTKESKYDEVADFGDLTAYPSTTEENDAIIIIKNATLHKGDQKETINIVAMQGTDIKDGQATGIKEDLLSGLELNNHYLYDVYQAVLDNIPKGEEQKLVVTGVSLGGMVAQQLAGLDIIKENYDVSHVVALGSPMISPEKIDYDETSVVRISDANDLVPHLSQSATKSDLEKNITIERESSYKTFISAHALSYVNEEIWKDIDILGCEKGKSYITFENPDLEIIKCSASNLEVAKEAALEEAK